MSTDDLAPGLCTGPTGSLKVDEAGPPTRPLKAAVLAAESDS